MAISKDEHIYNDISAIDCYNNADGVREDVYENYDSGKKRINIINARLHMEEFFVFCSLK